VIRTCVTAQLVAGAKREAVLKSLLSITSIADALLDCVPCHKRWSVPSTVALSAGRNTRVGVPRERSNHQGISAGATWGTGIEIVSSPTFWYKRSVGASEPPTLRASVEWANESISRLKTESFSQDFRHSIQLDTGWSLCWPLVARRSCSVTYPFHAALVILVPPVVISEIDRLEGKAGTNSVDGDGRRECPSRGTMVSTADR
jgi:hypothetical protein